MLFGHFHLGFVSFFVYQTDMCVQGGFVFVHLGAALILTGILHVGVIVQMLLQAIEAFEDAITT